MIKKEIKQGPISDFDQYGRLKLRLYADLCLEFKKACEMAEIEPTIRQASKFRNRRGLAYNTHLESFGPLPPYPVGERYLSPTGQIWYKPIQYAKIGMIP